MTDEQRTDSLGCFGSPWARTPNIDRLAGEGALFSNAVTTSPVCVPARIALLTGQYPSGTGVWWNQSKHGRHLDHLTCHFAQAGYRTASFGKQHYCSPNQAFQTQQHIVLSKAVGYFRYQQPYEAADYDVVQFHPQPYAWIFGGRFPEPAENTSEAQATKEAIAWLDGLDQGQPFLLRVSFNGPHTPVTPPQPFDTLIPEDAIRLPEPTELPGQSEPAWIARSLRPKADASLLTGPQIRAMRRYYYGEAAFVDRQFGVLLDWMRARGLLENTIVVFVSDHGTHLGDFGLVQKQSFYEPVVRVPLVFWWPRGLAGGVRFDTPVETRCLLPTLLDLAGVPQADRCRDDSLAQALVAGREPPPRPVFSELTLGSFNIRHDDRLVMVRDGRWKLSMCLDPEPNDGGLYDLAADPYERENLFGRPECAAVQARLADLIHRHLAGTPRPSQ